MLNEKVEVQIGARHLIVEMANLLPAEISALAQKVSERLSEIQSQNIAVGDSSKIALLVALSFAADVERERQETGSSQRASIAGRIIELASPEGDGEFFRAVLTQEGAPSIRLLIPKGKIDLAWRAFVAGEPVTFTGRRVQDCIRVAEIARSA